MNTQKYRYINFAIITVALLLVILGVVSASNTLSNPSPQRLHDREQSVTLYTSVDDTFARMVAQRYTEKTGVVVHIVGDTEATKTTGLVARLKAEADHPIADLWWSSEPFGTIDLAQQGNLMKGALNGLTSEDWPKGLIPDDGS